MSFSIRIFLFILLLFPVAILANESAVATIDNLNGPFDLASFIETIEDANHEYTLEDIQSGKLEHLWQRNTADYFVGPQNSSKYWFRVSIRWDGQQVEKGVLALNSKPFLHYRLSVALPAHSESQEQLVQVGFLEPFYSRVLPGFRYGFPVTLTPGDTQSIIGWARNNEGALLVQLPFLLMSDADYADTNQTYFGIITVVYAVIAALLIYNGCLFASLRQPVYGVYLVFLCVASLQCSIIDGTTARYLWPTQPLYLLRLSAVSGVISSMVYLVFVVSALDGVRHWPNFKKVIWGCIVVGLMACLHNLITEDFNLAMGIAQIYASLIMPFTLVIILRAWFKKLPTASYLLIAEMVTMAGGTSFILLIQGVAPIHPVTMWGLHWGLTGEALLLSLALAARTQLAQQSAISNLEKYEKIYNDSLEGLFRYDFKSSTLKCNNALARLFGYDNAAELPVENNILSYFSEEVQEQLPAILMDQGIIQNYEAEISHIKTGNKIWVSMTMRIVKDDNSHTDSDSSNINNLIAIEGSIIDISERKLKEQAEQEQAMARKNEEISEAKNKAKTQFFASMSHEFRTPLTTILGYTEIAQDKELQESERLDHIKTIEHSAEHMLQLINDVLDLSKIEAQKLNVDSVTVDLFHLGQQVHDFIWILASKKGISFNIDYQFPLPITFTSDPTRLKQALINLCSNSVKFTHEGHVTLHISCDPDTELLSFGVEDTGIGLKADQVQKLFSAFTQADTSTSRTYGGTGLGLHLSKLIANKLGGDITVESEYHQGSTFTLTASTGSLTNTSWTNDFNANELGPSGESIVAIEKPERRATKDESSIDKDSNLVKVLLAEDNEVNQKLMGFQIKQVGADVVIATDGLEAVAHALLEDYDLVLMDMDMPKMDGMTAVRNLRDKEVTTPIVALTGNVSLESIEECKAAGCDGHLSKPIDIDKLKTLIDSLRPE